MTSAHRQQRTKTECVLHCKLLLRVPLQLSVLLQVHSRHISHRRWRGPAQTASRRGASQREGAGKRKWCRGERRNTAFDQPE
jgi:hypothetical protein